MREKINEKRDKEREIEKIISEILKEMGFSPNTKGYHITRTAITMSVLDNELMYNTTTLLYPKLAETYNTTVGAVDAAIRRAIDGVCDRGNKSVLSSYLGYSIASSADKPTSGKFIARVADEVYISHLARLWNDSY